MNQLETKVKSEPRFEDLTHEEARDRHLLERQVERAFYLAALALLELRERRLYRSTHSSFENYCQDRFGFSRRRADYLIASAMVVDNLKQEPKLNQDQEPLVLILPTSERQCRPLIKLKPIEQRQAWARAVELAQNRVPSGNIVSQAVSEFKKQEPKSKHKMGQKVKIESTHPLFANCFGTIGQIPNSKGVIVELDNGQTEFINNEYIKLELDSSINELPPEGIAYTQGVGIEYNVRLSQDTWDKLNAYAAHEGAASLDGAISRLLDSVSKK